MDKERVENWIEENKDRIGLEAFSIDDVRKGESNHNFIIQTGSEKLVLRVSREISRRNRLENEYLSLKLLENEDIDDVPRSKFFSSDTEFGAVIIESFVGVKDLNRAGEMEKTHIEKLAEMLAKIHQIGIGKYNRVFDKYEDKEKSLRSVYRKEFEKWSEEPYREYLDTAEEPQNDLKQYFKKQKELVDEVPEVKVDQSFIHSDLGFNLRTEEDKISIVDWEYGTAGYPGHDIMILFEHGQMSERQRELFLKEYKNHRELGETFQKVRDIHKGFLAFHDAVWAAKRLEKEGETEDRKKILKRKMKKLETFYKNRE